MFIPAKFKETYLVTLLTKLAGNKTIIFTSTCNQTIKLALIVRNLGFKAVSINGQLSQQQRLNALNKFKTNERNILIATDVASRGLDIPEVDIVVNYDIPQNSKDYVHRVGRTARAGKTGRAITIVTQYDVEIFQKIEHLIGKKLDEYKGVTEEEAMVLNDRVVEAQRLANLELKNKDGVKGMVSAKDTADDEEAEAGDMKLFAGKKRKHGGGGFGNKSFARKRKRMA